MRPGATWVAFAATGVPMHPVRASEKDLRVTSSGARISRLRDVVQEYLGLMVSRMHGWR
jgi:hypothetical protein